MPFAWVRWWGCCQKTESSAHISSLGSAVNHPNVHHTNGPFIFCQIKLDLQSDTHPVSLSFSHTHTQGSLTYKHNDKHSSMVSSSPFHYCWWGWVLLLGSSKNKFVWVSLICLCVIVLVKVFKAQVSAVFPQVLFSVCSLSKPVEFKSLFGLCRYSFRCPVCRYCQTPEPVEENKCFECGVQEVTVEEFTSVTFHSITS